MKKIFEVKEEVLQKKTYYIQAESAEHALEIAKREYCDPHEEARETISISALVKPIAEENENVK